MNIQKTKKELLSDLQTKYGKSSVNEFLKNCMSLAYDSKDFFSDMIFRVIEDTYIVPV